MQNLIEKMERAIDIDKQDAASSGVVEIKTVARYRWPMLEQFVHELKEVSAAVDAALDAKSKLIAALEREAAEASGGNHATLYEHFVTESEIDNYDWPAGATREDAIADEISNQNVGGWEFVSAALVDRSWLMFYRRPLPAQRVEDNEEWDRRSPGGRFGFVN